ncbi:MAG: TonB-dependent receptor [Verrucomicrobia bacterium]|nr:TonB-dependent receptor [Verrucomicrobiota bacterium]
MNIVSPPGLIRPLRPARRALVLALLATTAVMAQVAPTPSNVDIAENTATKKEKETEAVQLPAFEVKSSKDQGYFAKQSVSGMKTSQDLADMSANVRVIPRDLIDDIGVPESASDTLKFVASGVNPYVRGEQMQIRGQRVGFTMVDDIPDLSFFADNAGIDTYEVLKGPQALLYGSNPSLFGLVIKTTKKPLPEFQGSLGASIGDYGWKRVDFDITGPLAKGFSYRIVSAYQKSDGFNESYRDNRRIVNSTVQWTNGKATVRASYDWHQFDLGTFDAVNVIDNRGPILKPYRSPKGRFFRYAPSWGTYGLYFNDLRLNATYQWNENWQSRVYYQTERGDRPSIDYLYVGTRDFAHDTLTLDYFDYDENFESKVYGTDNIGKYTIGKVNLQTNFGYLYDTRKGVGETFTYTPAFITTSFSNPIDFSKIAVPSSPKNKPSPNREDGTTQTYYFLETLSMFDDRLIVNGGISRIKATNPQAPSNDTQDSAKRAGIVVKPIKNVSLYYGYATMFQATSATTIDINGNRLPNRLGEGNEVGVKTDLFGGLVNATVDYYWLTLSNIPVPSGLRNANGVGYYLLSPERKYTGYEADLQFQLTKNWQLTTVFWTGETLDTDGKRASNTVNESAGAFTRYNFTEGPLKNWNVGGGTYISGNRYFRGGQSFDGYSVTNVFIGYRYNQNLSYTLRVNNIFDKEYVAGAWSPGDADVGDPRMIRLSVEYRFR